LEDRNSFGFCQLFDGWRNAMPPASCGAVRLSHYSNNWIGIAKLFQCWQREFRCAHEHNSWFHKGYFIISLEHGKRD